MELLDWSSIFPCHAACRRRLVCSPSPAAARYSPISHAPAGLPSIDDGEEEGEDEDEAEAASHFEQKR